MYPLYLLTRRTPVAIKLVLEKKLKQLLAREGIYSAVGVKISQLVVGVKNNKDSR